MKIKTLISLITLFFAAATCGGGQAAPQPDGPSTTKPATAPEQPGDESNAATTAPGQHTPEVFIAIDASPALAKTNLKDIGSFAVTLFQLQLMRTAIVHPGAQPAEACGGPAAGAAPARDAIQSRGSGEGIFYVILGHFDILRDENPGTPSVTLNYSVRKCSASRSNVLIEPHDVTLSADGTVDKLNEIAVSVGFKIQKDRPRLAVAVLPCAPDTKLKNGADKDQEDKVERLLASVRSRIVDRLNQSDDFIATDNAEYTITCTLSSIKAKRLLIVKGQDTLRMTLSVQARFNKDPYSDPHPIHSNADVLKHAPERDPFVDNTASRALDWLRFVLASERLGFQGTLDKFQAKSFMQRGKDLLCLEVTCSVVDQDRKGALAAFEAANALDPDDAEILRYLGQAQMSNRLYTAAKTSLEKALTKLSAAQARSSLEAQINSLLGDANRFLANNSKNGSMQEASAHYLAALTVYKELSSETGNDRQAEVATYLKYARVLVATKDNGGALAALFEAIGRNPDEKDLHRQAQSIIRKIELPEPERAQEKAVCANPAQTIRDECALLDVQRAAKLLETDLPAALVHSKAAITLKPTNPQILCEALVYAATADINLFDQAGQGQGESLLNDADSLLREAEALPKQTSAEHCGGLVRLRSAYWQRKGDFESAYAVAKAALTGKNDSLDAVSLAAESALFLGEHLQNDAAKSQRAQALFHEAKKLLLPLVNDRYASVYALLMEANHGLQQDNETRQLFLQILDQNPRDESAVRVVMWTCEEFLGDFDCALSAAKKASTDFRTLSHGRQLDFIEAAMLKGDNEDALQWLKIVDSQRALPIELKPVCDFYAFWLSLNVHDKQKAKDKFADWRKNLQELRGSNKRMGWSFAGAKAVWSAQSLPEAPLMLQMIKAFEDPNTSLPDFPIGS